MSKLTSSRDARWSQLKATTAGVTRFFRRRETGFDWVLTVTSHAPVLVITLVTLILSLPLPNHMVLYRWRIMAMMVAYTFFILLFGVATRKYNVSNDSPRLWYALIAVNVLAISALVYWSGGEYSYFWLFYLLPLAQAVVYTSGGVALMATTLTIASFCIAALLSPTHPTKNVDYTRISINSIILLQLTYAFRWFFQSAKQAQQLQFEEIDGLRRTGLQITAQLEKEELLKLVIERAVELLKGVNGGIYLYDPDEEVLTVIADWGGEESIRGHKLRLGEGVAGMVAQTGKPKRIDDYGKWDNRSPHLKTELFKAVVAVPLTLPDRFLGVLYVADIAKKRSFSERDVQLLSLLGSQAAIAINNAEAFSENQRNLRLLNDVTASINSALTLRDILRGTLQEALRAVRTDEGSIMIFNPRTQRLEIEVWVVGGALAPTNPDRTLALGEGVAGDVAATRKARVWSVSGGGDGFVESFTGRNLRSILCVPVVSSGRLLCIINADSDKPDYFSESDKHLLTALASHVAIAIESQRLRDVGLSLSTVTTEKLYWQIVESACHMTSAEVSSLFLRDSQGGFERVAVFPEDYGLTGDRKTSGGLTVKIAAQQEPRTINDVQASTEVKSSVKDRGTKALMGVPLNVTQGEGGGESVKTLGVLFVSTTQDVVFTPRDEAILQSLANQAAVAVANVSHIEYQRSLIASALDAIVSIDRKGRIQEFNPSAERILGWRGDEIRGQHVSVLYHSKLDGTRVARALLRPHNEGRVIDFPTTLVHKDGRQRIPIRLSATLLKNGSVGFFQDQREIQSVRRHIEQLNRLLNAGKAITEPDDIQRVIQETAKEACSNLNADVVCLYSYDSDRKEIRLPPIREGKLLADEVPLDVGPHSIVEAVIRHGVEHDDIYFTDDAAAGILAGSFVKRERIKAVAACPLKVRDKIVGVMFCNYRDRDSLSDEEKAVIRVFAGEAAIAIDHAQLYEDTRKKAEQLHALTRAIPGLVDDLSFEGCLKSLLNRACTLTHAQLGVLALIDEADQDRKFYPFITYGIDPATHAQLGPLPGVNHGVFRELLEGKQVINMPQYIRSTSVPGNHPPISNFLGVPILFKGTPLGNLYVANKTTADKFSQDDERGLKLLAALAALYVRSARGEDYGGMETFDTTSLLLSRWAHNVRHIIADITLELTALRQVLLGTIYEANLTKISRALGDLSAPGHQIQLEQGQRGHKTFNLSLLLERALRMLDLDGEVKIKPLFRIEPKCIIKGNSLLLEFAFNILLDNAVEAIRRTGRAGTLRVECSQSSQRIRVRINDTGDGISPKIQRDLFRRPVAASGSRMGYASLTAASILKLHRGEINIFSTVEGEGTTIEVRLPSRPE